MFDKLSSTHSQPTGPATPRTVDLQAARRAATEKFEAIALAHLPPGWRVLRHRRNLSGYCDLSNKVIVVPRPYTRKALYIFLHECAHAHLHHNGNGRRNARHVEEARGREVGTQKNA